MPWMSMCMDFNWLLTYPWSLGSRDWPWWWWGCFCCCWCKHRWTSFVVLIFCCFPFALSREHLLFCNLICLAFKHFGFWFFIFMHFELFFSSSYIELWLTCDILNYGWLAIVYLLSITLPPMAEGWKVILKLWSLNSAHFPVLPFQVLEVIITPHVLWW